MHFKHLRGKHDQKDHGRRGGYRSGGEAMSTLGSALSGTSGRGPRNGGSMVTSGRGGGSSNEGYALRPYDRAEFALDGPKAPALAFSDILDPSTPSGSRLVSVMEQTPTATRVTRMTVHDHFRNTTQIMRQAFQRPGPVSDRDFRMAERELQREQRRVRDYAIMVQDRESIGDPSGADIARGLLIESYAVSEVYRDVYNQGVVERRASQPHPTEALMDIQSDGTIIYVPSQRAIAVARAMNDTSHPFGNSLRDASRIMKQASEDATVAFEELITASAELAQATSPEQRQRAKNRIRAAQSAQQATRQIEADVHQRIVDACTSLGFEPQSQGTIPAVVQTNRVSLDRANVVQRVGEERLRVAQTLLRQIVADPNLGFRQPVDVILDGQEQRAYAKSKQSTIVVNPQDNTRVVLHELLHVIEEQNPVLRQRMNAFLQTRTRSSTAEPLSSYGAYDANEVTKADNFGNPYMGKIYKGGGTELLSMFSDFLMTPPDARMKAQLHDDTEYLQFVIDALLDPRSFQ